MLTLTYLHALEYATPCFGNPGVAADISIILKPSIIIICIVGIILTGWYLRRRA
jgi:hypothetical protein